MSKFELTGLVRYTAEFAGERKSEEELFVEVVTKRRRTSSNVGDLKKLFKNFQKIFGTLETLGPLGTLGTLGTLVNQCIISKVYL